MPTDILAALTPIFDALDGLDLHDAAQATATLQARVPAATMAAISTLLVETHATNTLTPKQATPAVAFGRLAKPSPQTRGFSVDVVDMRGAGAVHTHPKGEVSWVIALEDSPTFEGQSYGWVVMPPGSRHVPTAVGGRMLIVYFLPDGAMDWSA